MELMGCTGLSVPPAVMEHVVKVESSLNPYAIGVVGARLARQPRNLAEALSTARMLETRGYNFSLGLAQVNRYNLARQGLDSYEKAFDVCPNLQAGSRILAECYARSGNSWGKAFSCYYSGNFTTGYRHGYVQKVFASWRQQASKEAEAAIAVIDGQTPTKPQRALPRTAITGNTSSRLTRRIEEARNDSPTMRTIGASIPTTRMVAPAAPVAAAVSTIPPATAQGSIDTPVLVQPYQKNADVKLQVSQAARAPGRDDAFVF
ncbi:lytic transglycosylase domain-containing protein [Pseudoxanthomonas sp. CF385]|uniref:transglycosylase SLT domain-containing protein n=1 Tax=Pseudoxanthomonas sp. CF385 TaxID=1881042 RepID=UPI00158706CF